MAFHIHNQVAQVFSQVLPDSTQDRAESLSFRVILLNAFHGECFNCLRWKSKNSFWHSLLMLARTAFTHSPNSLRLGMHSLNFVLVIVTLSERQPTANSILHIKSLQWNVCTRAVQANVFLSLRPNYLEWVETSLWAHVWWMWTIWLQLDL